jgi:hypothetical protein
MLLDCCLQLGAAVHFLLLVLLLAVAASMTQVCNLLATQACCWHWYWWEEQGAPAVAAASSCCPPSSWPSLSSQNAYLHKNPKPLIHDRPYCHDRKTHTSFKTAAKDTTQYVTSLVYVVHWSLIYKILVDQSSRKLWRTTKLQNHRVKHRLELELNSSILLPLLGADIFLALNTYMKAKPWATQNSSQTEKRIV